MVWWNVPAPARRNTTFADLIEENPTSVSWHSDAERDLLIGKMSPVNKAKLEAAKRAGRRMVGCVYKRTRLDERGVKVQRAEVRFDDVAGCLRTPAGGSSRQVIIVVDGKKVRSRLISARETARLMGLDERLQASKKLQRGLPPDRRRRRRPGRAPPSRTTFRTSAWRQRGGAGRRMTRHPLRARSAASRRDRAFRRGSENPSS